MKRVVRCTPAVCWLLVAFGQRETAVAGAYTFTTIDHPLGANGTALKGISGNLVVGSYRDSANIAHAFIYNIAGSTFTILDHPLTVDLTAATGISGNNIVGYYSDQTSGNSHGFLYDILTSTYTAFDHPLGVHGNSANGISGDTIVGSFSDASGNTHGYLATPVPDSCSSSVLPRW